MADHDSTSLVTLVEGEARTTTLVIAEFTGNKHEGVIKLVRKHQADLEQFGLVRFEIRARAEGQHGGGNAEIADLNEQQATLMLTYMRNTERVRELKTKFVSEFFRMRQSLTQPPATVAPPAPDHTPALIALHADQSARKDGHIAELLSQQARLIALLEQRPTATAALPAPSPRPMRPQAAHLTVAGRLAMENVQVDAATKRAINNAVLADYRRNNKPFAVTVNGYGLFHIQRIDFHTRRILGMPGGQQQALEF